jgi:hypothetical protein
MTAKRSPMRAVDADVALSSPMHHDPDPTPWPDVSSVASSDQDHPAPALGCRCGSYAAGHEDAAAHRR